MADNPNVDLAQSIMIERYDLDEQTYSLVSFSEGSKAITIRMSDGFIPLTASFPNDFLEIEKIRRMSAEEKRARFMFILPEWNKLPMDVRMLFEDIADNVDYPDELPTLRGGFSPAVQETEPEVPHLHVEVNGKQAGKIPLRRPAKSADEAEAGAQRTSGGRKPAGKTKPKPKKGA